MCFPELSQYRGGERVRKLEIGLKIGGKTQETWNRWVEKWAKFEIGLRETSIKTTIENANQSIQEEELKEGEI